ncbi:ATP-binding protein, partial [Thermodesulfobacteriota bacterium]
NKALGMSEQYGLRVSYFLIGEMLKKTIADKSIRGNPIYQRFLMLNASGRPLVDTAAPDQGGKISFPEQLPASHRNESTFLIDRTGGETQILLTAPCFHNGRFVGELVARLNLATLFAHFVDSSPGVSMKNFHLINMDGLLICPPNEKHCPFPEDLKTQNIAGPNGKGFLSIFFLDDAGDRREMLVTRRPLHNLPLSLVSGVSSKELYGNYSPWQLLLGTVSLAVVILIGIAVLIRSSAQNLILKTRFDESKLQQEVLAAKNLQLESEIRLRIEAETKLEKQRALRIRSDRLRNLGEMAAGIAHELNQPLVGVRGLAELILLEMEDRAEISWEEVRDNVGMIVEQADRMVHIINHVRSFARDAGSPRASRVDLNDVVRSGTRLLESQFKSNGLILEKELAEGPLPVRINPFSVEEVILNLLNNARDAVELRKQAEGDAYTPQVRISTRNEKINGKRRIRLEIRDNGKGVPQDIAEKIFDPFFTTKDPDKGTGLGLSISKAIVEGFGGNVEFTSTMNEGTSFTIDFFYLDREKDADEQSRWLKHTGSG